MRLREYQQEAVASIYHYFEGESGNPVLCLPTGAGKSVIQAAFVQEVCTQWRGQRIMLLSHVKELLEQNAAKLRTLWPSGDVGTGRGRV